MKLFTLSVFILFIPTILFGQDCTDYHKFHCPYGDYTYFESRQSKSLLFSRGQTSEIQMVAYGGEDYYIAICAHRKFGNIRFRIIEDDADRIVLYDNADNEYSDFVSFTNETTKNLVIEVSVPDGSHDMNDRRCVGVVIQFRKTEKRK